MQNSMDPGRIALNGDPLKVILMEAFKVKMDQIVGPSWLDADCFSIVAKMPEGATRDQLPAMLQALLVERFKLAIHKETHLRAGYALIVDKNGPKFKESDPTSPAARPRGQVTFGFAPAAGRVQRLYHRGLACPLSFDQAGRSGAGSYRDDGNIRP
jgi:uncharacterized protein (TIGR03435 family)